MKKNAKVLQMGKTCEYIGEVKGICSKRLRIELVSDEKQPGRHRIFLNRGRRHYSIVGEAPHVGFRFEKAEMIFSGMSLPEDQRGKDLSGVLMEVAFKIGEVLGELRRTDNIRKPLIALLLTKYGFEGTNWHFPVQVIPGVDDRTYLPRVRVKSNVLRILENVPPRFFQTVKEPINPNDPFPIVPVSTTFELTDPSRAEIRRSTFSDSRGMIVRVFPRPLKKKLGI